MVALLPSPRDPEVARVLGCYRIPLRTAPKVFAVDFLAFYQLASFGDWKWNIEKTAQLQGRKLVTRAEKWNRITFFYITGQYIHLFFGPALSPAIDI